MRKIILTLVFFMATLATNLTTYAQSTPPPVATGNVTVADGIAAYQKGHIVRPNPKVIKFFQDIGEEDFLAAATWYKYKGLLYGFFLIGSDNAIVFVLKANGDFIDLITVPIP